MCLWVITACLGIVSSSPSYVPSSQLMNGLIPPPILVPRPTTTPAPTMMPNTTTMMPNTTTMMPNTTIMANTTTRPPITNITFPTFPTLPPLTSVTSAATPGITPPFNVTPTQQPIPSVDPRFSTDRPMMFRDDNLVRFGGGDYQDIVIHSADSNDGPVQFPRNKRWIRKKRQSNCGCFLPAICPENKTQINDGAGVIDFRIVTGLNNVQQCVTGLKYCCVPPIPQMSCGSRVLSNIVYPTQTGQARYGDYPWMVVMLTNDNLYLGGGVLIDLQHVLTAAHKVSSYVNSTNFKIRLGEWDAAGNYEQYPYRDFAVSKIWIHESFNPLTLQNDTALIRLTGGVPAGTPAIVPICMPTAGQVFDGQKCWVSGWGKNAFGVTGQYQTVLKTVDLTVLAQNACETNFRATRLGPTYVYDRYSFICAGGETDKDACTGDGGSGLVCETTPGRWTLAGLVAWGIGCASQGIPAAYVNINSYLPWITSKQALPN